MGEEIQPDQSFDEWEKGLKALKTLEQSVSDWRSIPKSDYLLMSGVSGKVANEQGDLYEISLRGKTVDGAAVLRDFHSMLAKYKHSFTRARRLQRMAETSDGEEEGFDYWTEEKMKEQTLELRHKRELRERESLFRSDVRGIHQEWAARFRKLSEEYRRLHPAAHLMLEDAMNDAARIIESLKDNDDLPTTEA